MSKSGFVAFLFFSLACLIAFAQYTNGTLGGAVSDPGGGAVPEATVTIRNQETGYTKSVQTSADGQFLFPATPLGSYKLTVESRGSPLTSKTASRSRSIKWRTCQSR
ncbi:MAG: carboxypeptidase-like regulatory domain-containing protein, partial [Acidobacteriota bacterium]|nr:carboxypeptidase-like regulatory domain-containing protein [Acidobacteriota bacterium]